MFKITLVSIQKLFIGFSRMLHSLSILVHNCILWLMMLPELFYKLSVNVRMYINHMGLNSGSKLLVLLYNTNTVVIQCTMLQPTGTDQGI